MTKEEAKSYLNLTSEEYNFKTLRKKYTDLLYLYHPDNENDIDEEEKNLMIRNLNEAYRTLKEDLKNRQFSDSSLSYLKKIGKDYSIEKNICSLSQENIPVKIRPVIDEYYRKFKILYQKTKIKLYDLQYDNHINQITSDYEEKYNQYRKEITYIFFNYLENEVQKEGNRSSLYHIIFYEYCEKYKEGSPYILNSIFEIVQKFLSFLPIYIEKQQEIKVDLKNKTQNQIDQKMTEYQELEYYLIIKDELEQVYISSIQQLTLVFDVPPINKINISEVEHILKTFNSITKGIIEGYQQFILSKNFIIDNLEKRINQKIEDLSTKQRLLLQLIPLYDQLDMERFYSQIEEISQVLSVPINEKKDESPKKYIFKKEDN